MLGRPVQAQQPDNAAVEAITGRRLEFLHQAIQIEVGETAVTTSFPISSRMDG